jgi:hypothetical protein
MSKLKKSNEELVPFHCNYKDLEYAKAQGFLSNEVHTTFRDPLHTAASWINRGLLLDEVWCEQWDCWDRIMNRAIAHKITSFTERHNASEDTFGLHRAIEDNNWDLYFSYIPKNLINYAKEKVSHHEL